MTRLRAVLGCFLFVTACGDPTGSLKAPPAPEELIVTVHTGEISLAWRADSTAISYHIEVSSGGGAWLSLANLTDGRSSFTHVNVEHGVEYHYRIRGCNEVGCSEWAEVKGMWIGGQPPLANKPTIGSLGEDFVRVSATIELGGLPTEAFFAVYRPDSTVFSGIISETLLVPPRVFEGLTMSTGTTLRYIYG
jgi:hypothetical protein